MGSMTRRSRAALLPSWSVLPLRIVVGYGFIAHGYAKVMNGPERFIATLNALHVPAPAIAGWLTIVIELLGGVAILAGAFVTLASIPLAIILLVAMFTVHLPYGFSSIKLRGVTAAGPNSVPLDTKPTFYTSHVSPRWSSAVPVRWLSTIASGSAWTTGRSAAEKSTSATRAFLGLDL